MKKTFKVVFVALFVLFSIPVFGVLKNRGSYIVYPAKISDELYKVYKVYEDGGTRMIFQLALSGAAETSYDGTTIPQVSPDNKYLAYSDEGAVRVKDIVEGRGKKIAPAHDEEQLKGLVNGWSHNGKKLLYHVMESVKQQEVDYENRPEDGSKRGENSKAVKNSPAMRDSGYFVYDTSTGRSTQFPLKGVFVSWGNGDEIICQYPSDGSRELISVDASGNTKALFKYNGWGAGDLEQIKTDKKPDKAAAMAGISGKSSRLILIDLVKNSSENLTGMQDWGKAQWPNLSPSGTSFSWMQGNMSKKEKFYIYNTFVVDKKEVFKTQDYIDEYRWVSDKAVAVITRSDTDVNSTDELYVINPETGKILGMTPLK
jgi:hypothetical protein